MNFRPALWLFALLCHAQTVPLEWQAALNHISAESMRGHLSFLSSDLLEGRDTPSRGLDVAAEYIAAQFRRAGLEGQFHESPWKVHRPDMSGFSLELTIDGKAMRIDPREVQVISPKGFRYTNETALVAVGRTSRDDVEGRVVYSGERSTPPSALSQKAALVLMFDPRGSQAGYFSGATPFRDSPQRNRAPAILIHGGDLPKDPKEVAVSLTLAEPTVREFKMRNVLGLLRGSDPELGKTFVVVTAHYDHIGTLPTGMKGDRIFNGANDDGSGATTVLEVAGALSALTQRPRRSILFMTVAGEEKGMLGTKSFLDNPTVPIDSIVANINIEVMGRTDQPEGRHEGKLAVTGIDYSSLGATLIGAGADTGIEVYKHPQHEAFFSRSDNLVFARRGIPAHTVANGFEYPGYHTPDDEWQKIDYDNMTRLARTIALGILRVADSPTEPEWADIPATKSYRGVKRGQASSTP